MNIFFLDECPSKSADYMCDQHISKMIVETAQILSMVHFNHSSWIDGMYKPTHKNNPTILWAGDSKDNYIWLYNHLKALCYKFTLMYNKIHKTQNLLDLLKDPPKGIKNNGIMPKPQIMPDNVKSQCAIDAHRKNYRQNKMKLRGKSTWKFGIPDFLKD